MNYDKPLLAMLIGVIVIIPLELIGLFFKHLGWITITNGEACSMMFMPEGSWIFGGFLAGILMKKYLFEESSQQIKIRRFAIASLPAKKKEHKRFKKPIN